MPKARGTRRLDPDSRIEMALRLLAALNAAPRGSLPAASIERELGLDDRQLEEIVTTIQALADRMTGTRVAIGMEGGTITLEGSSARIAPLRLERDEELLCATLLDSQDVPEGVRARLTAALCPETVGSGSARRAFAEPSRYGAFYREVSEAADVGMRLRIAYRSVADGEARDRIVDPGAIRIEDGSCYLVAWDVERGAQRRYRLDRITAVADTGESAENHPYRDEDIAESLRNSGRCAIVSAPGRRYLEQLGWAGIDGCRADGEGGRVQASVHYSSEAWLFSQVLSAGGDLRIVAPASLRTRLAAYAGSLLEADS